MGATLTVDKVNGIKQNGHVYADAAADTVISTGLLRIHNDACSIPLIGYSAAIATAKLNIHAAASTGTDVLLIGETGTGKDLAAEAIHKLSIRSDKPFIPINCASIDDSLADSELFGHVRGSFTGALNKDNEGLIMHANNGTVFFDEITELSLHTQAKLLRFLQEREIRKVGDVNTKRVDVRAIAASNKDPKQEIEKGTFRADLYHRLNKYQIRMPSLEQIREDIPALFTHFVKSNQEARNYCIQIVPEVFDFLMSKRFDGNARELENCANHAVIKLVSEQQACYADLKMEKRHVQEFEFSDIGKQTSDKTESIAEQSVPAVLFSQMLRDGKSINETLLALKKQILIEALIMNNGNLSRASKQIGLSRAQADRLNKRPVNRSEYKSAKE